MRRMVLTGSGRAVLRGMWRVHHPPTSDSPAIAGEEGAPAEAPPAPVVREVSIPDGTSLRLDLATPLTRTPAASRTWCGPRCGNP